MKHNPYMSFICMVEYDKQLDVLESKIEQKKDDLFLIESQDEELQNKVQNFYQEHKTLLQRIKEKECHLVALSEKKSKKIYQQQYVLSLREYDSFAHEIQQCAQEIEQCEKELIALWELSESVEKNYSVANHNLSVFRITKKDQQNKIQCDINQYVLVHQELLKQREYLEPAVLGEWRERYSLLRNKVSDAAVEVIDNACQGCYAVVPPALRSMVDRHILATCSECYRIIYDSRK